MFVFFYRIMSHRVLKIKAAKYITFIGKTQNMLVANTNNKIK